MALDSILLNPIIPPPAKSAAPQAPSPIDPGSTNGFGNAARLTNSTDTADTAGSSGGPAANRGAGSNGSTTADAAKRSSSGSSSSSSTDTRRPTRSSSTSGSSSSNSSSASSSSGAKTPSGKARDNGSPRDKTDSAQRGSRTQRGIASAAGIEQGQSTGPTFLQALAQSQAEAQAPDANTDTAAAKTAERGKPKSTHDAPQDASASLAFLPQSLAAAMAGAQVAAQPQPTAQASTSSGEDDSTTEAIPGSGGSATRAVLASLEKGAEDLKATAGAADGVQSTAQSSTTPAGATTPDGTNAAAIAFQAHMSVSSHFQQPSTEVNAHKVEAPVGTPAFTDEVGGKITWLANQGVQSASLQLSPEHLGPVNVHISVQDGSATVSFNAAHVDTRTALEQALPRLREMFSTQGLTLTDASVSHQSPRGQHQKQAISSINSIGGVSDDSNATSITSVASTRLGLVDTYV